jgi:hypothetical protein
MIQLTSWMFPWICIGTTVKKVRSNAIVIKTMPNAVMEIDLFVVVSGTLCHPRLRERQIDADGKP